MAICTNCGSEIKDGATFCPQCGKVLLQKEKTARKRLYVPFAVPKTMLTHFTVRYAERRCPPRKTKISKASP